MNVGGDLTKLVPGRVSTEVDARLAYDKHGIINKVFRSSQCLLRSFFWVLNLMFHIVICCAYAFGACNIQFYWAIVGKPLECLIN